MSEKQEYQTELTKNLTQNWNDLSFFKSLMENGTTTNYSISGQITCLTIQTSGIQNLQNYQQIQITTWDQNRMKYSNGKKNGDHSTKSQTKN